MPTTVRNTDILFNDSSTQSTSATSLTIKATTTFDSSGTYTKASGASGDTVIAIVIGGGGGGARGNIAVGKTAAFSAGGGGGGGVVIVAIPYNNLDSTTTVTVGSGGAGRATTTGAGSIGGTSQFGDYAIAQGGGGGLNSGADTAEGGAGGYAFAGLIGNGNTFRWHPSFSSYGTSAGNLISYGWTGGGGAYTRAAVFRDGGTGRIFGNGGNSGGAAGSAGGGGGAAGIDANGGAGGAGKVIVVVVAGKVSAAEYMENATSSPGITAIY
jgi:hypothetical protein